MKDIFIIGSKGIPAKYGGFETFVENLTANKKNEEIRYHISCKANNKNEFIYNGARCFNVRVPDIGSASAILYDLLAIKQSIKYIKQNQIKNAKIYILTTRIGPFIHYYKKIMKKLGIKLYLNPDGHEWQRAKWGFLVKKYWKISERLMVKEADLIICDSKNIEKYIKEKYIKYNPNTIFIAYGADIEKSKLKNNSEVLNEWYSKNKIRVKNYYLIIGRFVPENNFETMIKEFMKSNTSRDLVIITNENEKLKKELIKKTHFEQDKRIKFVGTIYEKELIKKIRENAYAYLHGHSVGGTNPSLIEALATTKLNLLYNVNFNEEVAKDGALYWNLEENNLANLINKSEILEENKIIELSNKAKRRILKEYTWEKIVNKYEKYFLRNK